MGWIGWSIVVLAMLAVALVLLWRWALATQSVAMLDRADALFTRSGTEQSAVIRFGRAPGQNLVVARPARNASPRPVVIFIHGGSWSHGTAAEYAFVARNLAREGYVGVSAGYRLVPGGEYPAMLQDGAAAVRWVHENISRFGGDPDRIVLMGHSAGAYNAVMLALDRQWIERAGVPPGSLRGAIGLAGPYDFLPLDSDSTRKAFGQAADLASTQPLRRVAGDAPPLLLMTGEADTTVRPRNTRALARAMAAAGRSAETVFVPDMGHVGILLALSQPLTGDRGVRRAIAAFLARHTRHAETPVGESSGDIQAAVR